MVDLGHVGGCGITDSVSQWMEQIQNSAVEVDEPEQNKEQTNRNNYKTNKLPKKYRTSDKVVNDNTINREKKWKLHNGENETPYDKYSREANSDGRSSRSKRATRPKEENKNTCSLFIETDPLIWRHIAEQASTKN